jgi:sulfate adenylyltransferase
MAAVPLPSQPAPSQPAPSQPAQYHPGPRELDDLELLTSGALHPTTCFDEPG